MSLASPKSLEGGSGGGLFDGGGAAATQPSLTVTDRTDGEAYTVSAGARSLAISTDAGATLATSVELASDGSSVTVTDSTTTAPSWTAPAAISGGDSYQVKVQATKDGLTSSVSFTERVVGTTGGGAWVTLKDYDLTDLTTTSALATGTHTLSFESIADTIDIVFSRYNDAGGITVQATNGSGIVYDGGTDTTSAGTVSFRPSDWLASYTADDVQRYVYAFTFAFTADLTANPGSSGFYCGVNTGNNTTHNSGDSRHFLITSAADGINETVKIRTNTTSTGTLATQALRTTRTVTAIVTFGEIVQLMDNTGLTIPTPDVTQGTTYNAGSDAVGRNDDTRVYQNSSGIRAFLSCLNTGDLTLSRVVVQRFE
jgi:hypothetical protein